MRSPRSTSDPSTVRASIRTRPLETRVLVLFHLVAAVCCLVAAAVPMSSRAPRALGLAVAGVALLVALAVWRDRTPRSANLALAHALVTVTALVAAAQTAAGAMLDAYVYLWIVLFAAFFRSAAATRACSAAAAAGLAIGLAVNPPPGGVTEWFVIATSCAAAGEAVSRVIARLRALSLTDPLTGLPNRAGLARLGALACARADRRAVPLTVVGIDLDGFKQVNDRQGHAAGDALLVGLSSAWQRELRAGDVLARMGGDEFVLLLPDTTAAQAEDLLARLRAAFPATWSAGVAQRRPGEDLEACEVRADRAMYEQKRAHRRDSATPAGTVPLARAGR